MANKYDPIKHKDWISKVRNLGLPTYNPEEGSKDPHLDIHVPASSKDEAKRFSKSLLSIAPLDRSFANATHLHDIPGGGLIAVMVDKGKINKLAYIDQFASDPYVRESVTTDAHGVGRLLSGRTMVEVMEDTALKKRPIPARPERRDHQTKLSYVSYSDKQDPEQVGYDEMGGNQSQRCGRCVHFMEPNACEIVRGSISSDGICDLFDPITEDKTASFRKSVRDILLESFLKHAANKMVV
jgi:hypothetical protein